MFESIVVVLVIVVIWTLGEVLVPEPKAPEPPPETSVGEIDRLVIEHLRGKR